VTPAYTPLFFNLPAMSDESLRTGGGAFGAVLRLFRDRNADHEAFQHRLAEVVRELELLPTAARMRWLELLSYIHALVYHVREDVEQPQLGGIVEASVSHDPLRRAIMAVRRTGAQAEFERGALVHSRNLLLQQLQQRFGDLPDQVTNRVREISAQKTLDKWMVRFATAKSLDDVGILPRASARS
jgi:hypothetical protein